MNLSGRERTLAILSLSVILLLALDQYLVTPLFEKEEQLQLEREQILADVSRAEKLSLERKRLTKQWKEMLASGLSGDPAAAEGQVLHAIRDWAKEAGLSVSSLKPERPETKETLKEIVIQANGSGKMEGVARFMFKLQEAAIPLKVTAFQLSSRNDGTDELNLQLKVSTLYVGAEKKDKEKNDKSSKVAASYSARAEGGRR